MALSLFTALPAQYQPTPTPRDDMPGQKLAHADRAFLEKATKSGMEEVDISQAVSARLTNPQVRELAQSMVKDHMAVNAELTTLATRKGVALPVDKMKAMEKWSKKDKDLDEDYLEAMQDDHQEAVKLFEKACNSDDPDIAAFARKTLPSLQHHLQMVNDLKKIVK